MAENRITVLQTVLENMGRKGRMRFTHISTAERGRLPRLIGEMTESVRSLGPIELLEQLQ